MTDYQKMYQEKLTTPDRLAQQVQSGWLLGMDTATSQTPAIMTAIAEHIRNSDITGVKVQALLDAYPFEFYTDPTLAGKMTGYSWFSSSAARKAVNAGYADIIPAYYRDFPTRIRTEYDYDAVCVEVAPMDRHGYFNLSAATGVSRAILDRADIVILEVNEHLPRLRGGFDEVIHISDVDMVVEGAHAPFADLPAHPATAEDTAIANLLLPHICDGATVQLGIGGMPTVLGKLLAQSGLRDLGMHTELCSDAYLDLYEAGVLTNRRCTLHRGQGMLGIALGSKRLYDWLDDNPGVIAAPLSYVNAPEVIAQLDNMVSINSCIAADLYGQVASESSGLRQISGTGGQLDFLTGAAMARGGKAFICMTSTFTDKQGTRRSRILPHFGGDIVTSPRSQAYYLATEYGVVNLAGRSTWERAEGLVSIAHPDFREQLIAAAEAQKIWRRSAKR